MDIHKIVDVFNKHLDVPHYSRLVGFDEIEKNDFNLNLPRYIDSQALEDLQDIEAHLRGGIPCADVDALQRYWTVCPSLKTALFKDNRPGYLDLGVAKAVIKTRIYQHPEFSTFITGMNQHFATWRHSSAISLKALQVGCQPKAIITTLSENLLSHYVDRPLIDKYDIYQHLMDYWAETLQDDAYLIAAEGWKAETYRIIEKDKKGKEKDKGWTCDLVPKPLIVAAYFKPEHDALIELEANLENGLSQLSELEEEQGGEDGLFSELDKINKANVSARYKEIKTDASAEEEIKILLTWLILNDQVADLKKLVRDAESALDLLAYNKYPSLTEDEVKTLVVDHKWLATLDAAIHSEMDRISQALTQRVKELAERYETPMPLMGQRVVELEDKVNRHLEKMGFSWS
jgi:type I restriction enzyme M protein